MTTEEIKQNISMQEVLERYGIKVKRNMCSCPFHKDKHPSMKVFKDGVKCFSCNFSGDVFALIMRLDNCDFKTAFISLGGKYSNNKKATQIALYHAQKAKEKREQEKLSKLKKQKDINDGIASSREELNELEMGSDEWWDKLAEHHNYLTKDYNTEGGE